MIAQYPDFSEISIDLRPVLHPRFKALAEGVSEFTFANIYLFRERHNYKVSQLADGLFVIAGRDGAEPFFMLPFGLPGQSILGDPGLRQAKESYHPVGFVKKYRAVSR